MTDYAVKRLALVLSIQAEIEGMKSANKDREINGESMAYGEKCFYEQAEELRNLAAKHDSQL